MGSYNNYFIYKNILFFQDAIWSKYAPNCTIFSKFSRIGYALGPLAYMSANKL